MKVLSIATTLVIALTAVPVQAQPGYPNKPITIVVPYPAGGTSDNQIRLIAEPLSKALGQTIIIDNKAGASGAIAAVAVARSPADGYTLIFPNNGLLIAALTSDKAGYEPIKDFVPISMVSKVPLVLSVSKSVPAKNLRELMAYAKSKPGQLNYASAGPASYGNLATNLLMQAAGIKMNHIPYRGEANTTAAIRTDECQVLLTTPSSALFGLVQQKHASILGVGSDKPVDVVPDARPIAETLPGFAAEAWFALLAPAGTPSDVVTKVNSALQQVLKETKVRASLFGMGAVAQGSTPDALGKLMKAQYTEFQTVVRNNNIKAQ